MPMTLVSNVNLKLDSFTFDLKLPYIRQCYLQPRQIFLDLLFWSVILSNLRHDVVFYSVTYPKCLRI